MKTYYEICSSFGGVKMPPFIWGESGVYCISCDANNKQYVGCSKHILRRLTAHFSDLNKGLHPNEHLQSAWDKYGASSFYVFVIQYTEDIKSIEIEWIENYDSYNLGFNKTLGGDGVNVINPDIIAKHRKSIAESLRRPEVRCKIGEWSKKFHAENKEKMSKVLSENAKRGWEKRRKDKRIWINNGVEEKMIKVETIIHLNTTWKAGRLLSVFDKKAKNG